MPAERKKMLKIIHEHWLTSGRAEELNELLTELLDKHPDIEYTIEEDGSISFYANVLETQEEADARQQREKNFQAIHKEQRRQRWLELKAEFEPLG